MKINKLLSLIKKTNITFREVESVNQNHCLFGLISEVGEVAGVHQRQWRGDYGKDKALKNLKFELGDVMYYLFAYMLSIGLDPQDVYDILESKLEERLAKGKIKGNGDDR